MTGELGKGRFRCCPPRLNRVCAASRPTTDRMRPQREGERERERERKRDRERLREREKGARQIIGRQEAAVPEVAATAEAQIVCLS